MSKLIIKMLSTILPILFSGYLLAMDDENQNLLQGKFLIKNIKHQEYLYLSDSDKIGKDRVCKGCDGIYEKSIFTFEKNTEGYLIKNVKHDEYLFVATDKDIQQDKIVEGRSEAFSRSYFTILKENGSYVIKNTKYNEYLLLSNNSKRNGDRLAKSWEKLDDNSYFKFVAYQDSWGLF